MERPVHHLYGSSWFTKPSFTENVFQLQAACKDAWSFELDGNDVDPVKMPEKPVPAPSVTVTVTPTPAPGQQYTCSSLEVRRHL
jgi:hypothetical protein